MEPTNPYAPPTADLGDATRRLRALDDLGRARRGRRIWLVLFALNLVVPLILAAGLLAPAGWLGMGLAVIALGGGGYALLLAFPKWTGAAVTGAATIAVTQFFPMLHIIVGIPAVQLVGGTMEPGKTRLDLVQGFGAAFATGSVLIMASAACGLLFRAIGRFWRGGDGRPGEKPGPGRLHDPAGRV